MRRAALLLIALLACGDGSSSPTSPVTTAPVELQGRWVTVLNATDEQVQLTLGAGTYQVDRGVNHVTGRISVSGDRIEFFASTACVGTGAYRWSLTDGALLLTMIGTDPCPGRRVVLNGYTYTKGP